VPTVSVEPDARTFFSTARANSAPANPASFLNEEQNKTTLNLVQKVFC
jgi:hypothetical protein